MGFELDYYRNEYLIFEWTVVLFFNICVSLIDPLGMRVVRKLDVLIEVLFCSLYD